MPASLSIADELRLVELVAPDTLVRDMRLILAWAAAIRRQQALLDAVLAGRVSVSVEKGEVKVHES